MTFIQTVMLHPGWPVIACTKSCIFPIKLTATHRLSFKFAWSNSSIMQVTVAVSWKWHLLVFQLEAGLKLVQLGEFVLSGVRLELL